MIRYVGCIWLDRKQPVVGTLGGFGFSVLTRKQQLILYVKHIFMGFLM